MDGNSSIIISAFLPASMLPILSCLESAEAALIVSAVMISSTDILICIAASAITSGIEFVKQLPGLKSVASATAHPLSIMSRALA